MKQYVYQNDINLIKSLYESEFWKIVKKDAVYYHQNNKLKKDNSLRKLKSLIESIYVDPDGIGKALVAEMQDFYNEFQETQYIDNPYYLSVNNQKCSLDAIIGWKPLFQCRKGNKQWLEDLELIRGNKMGHLAFPVQKNSLNQLKGTLLKDRIDYALFDIKSFYENAISLKMQKAYEQEATLNWLMSFGSFNQFIDSMRLSYFVYKNPVTLKYDVIDLSIPYKNHSTHCLKGIPQKIKIEDTYITNILDYIKEFGEELSTTHVDLMYDYY
ncbi:MULTISPECIES: DUF6994 family protein [unclassified Staphylococcus]|uniref:DUF6994 family protein n=1 Tax=unclassified Staphylococcus TaxID=91994 RepID=UPI001880AECA|nr:MULTISPECIES: hypothetical protein [unclassified Staphylococcus]MBF2756372.1 hypothetical protein [Staphylococcus haemolyticus]MBF2773619.1 hypothetical protein [Staphylococcus haemolyticus]MBF2775736.1 hypothetical protein [Staphylococcus haemolyticus]MBF2816659.1 hypothetical protein [Staphylococcus haemolyticus]MBF9719922.1 hypothetical protein [Staphylococcus haemolyticus]